jgi:hypothetical protein
LQDERSVKPETIWNSTAGLRIAGEPPSEAIVLGLFLQARSHSVERGAWKGSGYDFRRSVAGRCRPGSDVLSALTTAEGS